MKLAYIITAHKNPDQLVRLVERLNDEGTTFFVHIDKGTDAPTYGRMVDGLRHLPNVHFMKKRFKCHYMTLYSAVQAVVQGMTEIFRQDVAFDYLLYVTGQDYPIKTNSEIKAALENAHGQSYLTYLALPFEGWHPTGGRIIQNASRYESWHLHLFNRYVQFPLKRGRLRRAVNLFLPRKRKFLRGFTPYGGWAYWCLARRHVEYAHDFVKANPSFMKFFRFAKSADEMFFQTMLLNSPFKDQLINDDLRYVDWSSQDCHPKLLGRDDIDRLAESPRLFARKFDATVDAAVLDLIDERLLKIKPAGNDRGADAQKETGSRACCSA